MTYDDETLFFTIYFLFQFNDALPNSLGIYVVDDPTWDHYDFSASPRAGEMILTPLIKEIDRVRISEESEMLTN